MQVKKSVYRFMVRSLISLGGIINSRSAKRASKKLGLEVTQREYTVTKNIVFTPSDWETDLRGDLYLPVTDKQSEETATDLPVVLLVHGGGWHINDNRYHMRGLVKSIVQQGFAVFSITYRLAPEYIFPAPVDDLLEAIKWLKNKDTELGLDMQRTAIYGYSAGGHLAELAAMRPMPEGVKIRAVVAGGAPHFLRLDPDFPLVRQLMGHPWQDDPDRYMAATPVDSVKEDFPPVFVYHGLKDSLVPRTHVDKWSKRLRQLDINHTVHWVKGRGHIGTFLMPRGAIIHALHFLKLHLSR